MIDKHFVVVARYRLNLLKLSTVVTKYTNVKQYNKPISAYPRN